MVPGGGRHFQISPSHCYGRHFLVKCIPSLKTPKGKCGTSFFTIHGNRVTACYASIERQEIYGEAEYVVSQSVYRHFAYPILYFAKGYLVVPRLRYSLGYAFFMLVGR